MKKIIILMLMVLSISLVSCTTDKTVVLEKQQANSINEITEYINAKNKDMYSEEDYQTLLDYILVITEKINGLTTVNEILELVTEYKTLIDDIATYDYLALKASLVSDVNAYLETISADDYEEADYQAILGLATAVKEDINKGLNNQTALNKMYTDFIAEVDAFQVIPVAKTKEVTLEALNMEYQNIEPTDYLAADYASISSLYLAAQTAISDSVTNTEVINVLKNFTAEVEKIAKIDLATYKVTALGEIAEYYQTISEVDYTPENYRIISGLYSTCQTNIASSTSVKAVNLAVSTFRAAVGSVEMIDIEAIRTEVLNEAQIYYHQIDSTEYLAPNYQAITSLYNDAIDAINEATTVGAINNALITFKEEAEKISKIDIVAYRQEVIANLDAYVALNCKEADYSSDNYQAITGIVNNKKSEIENALTARDIDAIFEQAKSELGTVSKLTLSDYQDIELEKVQAVEAKYKEADYSAENWQLITSAINQAKEDIASATLREQLLGILEDLEEYLNSIRTLSVEISKTTALNNLNAYITNLNQNEYSAENWATINSYPALFEAELANIDDVDDINTRLSQYYLLIGATEKVDVASYKQTAIESIANLYQENDYSQETLETISEMIKTLQQAINSATYYTEIDTLISEFVQALALLEKVTRTEELVIKEIKGYNGNYFNITLDNATIASSDDPNNIFKLTDLASNNEYFGRIHNLPNNQWAQVFFGEYNQTGTGNFILTISVTVGNITYLGEFIFISGQLSSIEAIIAQKTAEVDNLLTKLSIIEAMYEEDEWNNIQTLLSNAKSEISAATTYSQMQAILDTLETNVLAVPQKDLNLEELIRLAFVQIDEFMLTIDESKYTSQNYQAILALVQEAKTNIQALTSEVSINSAVESLKEAISRVEVIKEINTLNITEIYAYTPSFTHIRVVNYDIKATDNYTIYLIDQNDNLRYDGILYNYITNWSQYFFATYTGLQTSQYIIYLEVITDEAIYQGSVYVSSGKIETLETFKATKTAEVQNYFVKNNILESNYTPENWLLAKGYLEAVLQSITNATSRSQINEAIATFIQNIEALPIIEKTIPELIQEAKEALTADFNSKDSAKYSEENYQSLQNFLTAGLQALEACQSKEEITNILNQYLQKMAEVATLKTMVELTISNFNPHGVTFIVVGWNNSGVFIADATNIKLSITIDDIVYDAEIKHADGTMAQFFQVTTLPAGVDVAKATYTLHMEFEINDVIYYTDFNVVNGVKQ